MFPKRPIFLLEFAALHRARDQHFHLVEVKRFGHKIVSAALHRLHGHIDRTISSHHDADRRTRHLQRAIDQQHSVFVPEAQIGEEHVDLLALEDVYRAGDVRRDIDIIIVLEQAAQPIARVLLIVNDQNSGLQIHGFA